MNMLLVMDVCVSCSDEFVCVCVCVCGFLGSEAKSKNWRGLQEFFNE